MFERHQGGERAVLVHIYGLADDADEALEEFSDLCLSAGTEITAVVTGSRRSPEPKLFVGSGKAEEIATVVQANEADLVIFNHSLSPAQERNLERVFQCRVLDRTGLILDIFAQRARSHEGKLQVELAQLRHLSTRLVRGWTHLERQKGGIGLRGPGETQLETDRRLLSERIKYLNRRLQKVDRQREQGRRSRQRAELPTVSLVGYTNAGKSTLFNALTTAEVYAADQLFATLDPTLRKLELENGLQAVLADTVGFIRDLPHDLVAAFRSTLQETREARLLLHVIDASDPQRNDKIAQVNAVLTEIGANEIPQLLVFNKIDALEEGLNQPRIERDEAGEPQRVWVSAAKGWGFSLLREAIAECLSDAQVSVSIRLPPEQGRLRARLYELGVVCDESIESDGSSELFVVMERARWEALNKHENIASYLWESGSSLAGSA